MRKIRFLRILSNKNKNFSEHIDVNAKSCLAVIINLLPLSPLNMQLSHWTDFPFSKVKSSVTHRYEGVADVSVVLALACQTGRPCQGERAHWRESVNPRRCKHR